MMPTLVLGCVLAAMLYYLMYSTLRKWLLAKETVMLELPLLGQKRKGNKIQGTVVVCGGRHVQYPPFVRKDNTFTNSLSGLFTARICADHFDKVIVVETEDWLSQEDEVTSQRWQDAPARARVIQWKSAHAWLVFLYDALLRLFPNLLEACQTFGISVVKADIGVHVRGKHLTQPYIHGSHFEPNKQPKMFSCSRPCFESMLRSLVLDPDSYPDVSQISGTATGVIESESGKRLQGVIVKTPEGIESIDATLVIDCTGPAQAIYKSLPSAPSLDSITESYHPKMNYCTCHFTMTPEIADRVPISTYLLPASGDISRCLIMFRQDHLSMAVSCGAWGAAKDLPTTLDGIRQHVAGVGYKVPQFIWDALDLLQEVEDTVTSSPVRCPASFWTHYERAANTLPANYVAIGDSVGRVNPVFGQGATKALVGSVVLNTALHGVQDIDDDFAKRVHTAQAARMQCFWDGTKIADYAHKTTIPTEGETLAFGNVLRTVTRYVEILATTDYYAARMAWNTMMALDATSIDVFHPLVISKVIWMMLKENVLGVFSKA